MTYASKIAETREEGRIEGREEGREEGRVESLALYIKATGGSLNDAADALCNLYGMNREEAEREISFYWD